jgi:hypothetical protein
MSDRRNFERLLVPSESLPPAAPGEPAAVPNEVTDDTQPMRLSFLALLAERDPAVQARLERRRTLALEDELDDDEDRPTDPMIMLGR